jgi:multicomponent Na+:H+ antiporter subunit E
MKLLSKIVPLLLFLPFYIKEVVLSNLRVAHDVLTPRHRMRPAVFSIPLEGLNDRQILALANLITMTPGTLSLDVSQDKRLLYIHAMYAEPVEETRRMLTEEFVERARRAF